MRSSHISAIVCTRKDGKIGLQHSSLIDLRHMMDNAAGSLQAGALQLSETFGIEALHACIEMAYRKCISSVSFEAVCFMDASPVPFYLAHCCFIKTVLFRFDSDGIIHGN